MLNPKKINPNSSRVGIAFPYTFVRSSTNVIMHPYQVCRSVPAGVRHPGNEFMLWGLELGFRVGATPVPTFMKLLSMLLKRLASAGSCLTMSPPENTASMYIHRLCTCSQLSTCAQKKPCDDPLPGCQNLILLISIFVDLSTGSAPAASSPPAAKSSRLITCQAVNV